MEEECFERTDNYSRKTTLTNNSRRVLQLRRELLVKVEEFYYSQRIIQFRRKSLVKVGGINYSQRIIQFRRKLLVLY